MITKEKWEDIKDDLHRVKIAIRTPFYNFIDGIENLFKWFPIIWKDRDFDYHYIYTALHFKLKNTYDFLTSEYAWAVHHPNHLKKLKICIILLDRIIKDSYSFDVALSEFRPYNYDRPIIDGAEQLDDGRWRLRPMTEEERKAFIKHNDHSNYLLFQDRKVLFDTLNKYSMYWWD